MIGFGLFGDAASGPYAPSQKYTGLIPEITRLPLSIIVRKEMDFRPEVLRVTDAVARRMDFSEPVEVTAFRYASTGWASASPPRAWRPDANDDTMPQVVLEDGHHRLAAAIQTGRAWLPVRVKAINAKGEKLNALVALSRGLTGQPSAGLHGAPFDYEAEQRHLRCANHGDWKSSDGLSTGIPLDRALAAFARVGRRLAYRGEPEITIYRIVPAGVTAIRPGDWVALTSAYARTMPRGPGQKVLAQKVFASEVLWAGTDENEWWWCPR